MVIYHSYKVKHHQKKTNPRQRKRGSFWGSQRSPGICCSSNATPRVVRGPPSLSRNENVAIASLNLHHLVYTNIESCKNMVLKSLNCHVSSIEITTNHPSSPKKLKFKGEIWKICFLRPHPTYLFVPILFAKGTNQAAREGPATSE